MLQFINYIIIVQIKVLLPQASVTLADLGYHVLAHLAFSYVGNNNNNNNKTKTNIN
jgi:hypothetical protein